MRKTLIAFAAVSGLAVTGASAMPSNTVPPVSSVQQADWYCGPRCQGERRWEHRRWERERWRESQRYNPNYYGYNGYRGGYYYGYR
jgi:hypothetical protein